MKTFVASLVCSLTLLTTTAGAQVPRVLGVWEVDPAASSVNGRLDFIQIVSKSDGKDYPQYQSGPLAEFQVNGTQTPLTYSETIVDDDSVSIIAKVGGRVNNKGVVFKRVS